MHECNAVAHKEGSKHSFSIVGHSLSIERHPREKYLMERHPAAKYIVCLIYTTGERREEKRERDSWLAIKR